MNLEIKNLLEKPVWQMSGREFLTLTGVSLNEGESCPSRNLVYGMRALGDAIGCSLSTIYGLKKQGVLDGAIVSSVGRKIVFDADKARALAQDFQTAQRAIRKSE